MTKGRLGRLSDHTGHNASKRRAGLETRTAEADPPQKRGRLPAVGKRATRAPTGSAGVLAVACMEEGIGRNTGSPAGGVARANRQPARVKVGPAGWRRGPQYQGSRVMPVEGRDLRWKRWRKEQARGSGRRPSTQEMSRNSGRHHMHKRRGRPERSPSSGCQQV